MRMKRIHWKPLIASLSLSLGVGAISGFITSGSMMKYKTLYKPVFSPPGWVFPVVWTILYIMIGFAAYLVFLSDSPDKKPALKFYLAQLLVNGLWPVIFFRLDAYLLAFTWILLLWYLVLETTKKFYRINPLSGKLMAVYLLWTTYAAYLNFAIAIHYLGH